ncbi:MAG: hypothetical protein ACR2IN_01595 [Thermoleophilaceae bacterium]
MANRGKLLALIFAPVPFIVAAALFLATRGSGGTDFELLPVNPGGPVGLAHLEQDGDRVRGRIAVWGLGPGSRHLAELRTGACRPDGKQTAAVVSALPQLVADPNCVAFARVDARALNNAVEPGHYLMVYSGPGPARANARVSCGDLFGGGRLTPVALASVGPGAGARSEASTIVQLRDGRPIGGPQRIEVRSGDRVALAVRSDLPDELQIGGGLGLSQQVGPGTIARFSFLAPQPGRYAVRARTAGVRPVAVLNVRARGAGSPR